MRTRVRLLCPPPARRHTVAGIARWWSTVAACFVCAAGRSSAQRAAPRGDPALAAVRGVAFDSLAGRPLAGAVVVVEGTARMALADSAGRFAISGVPVGAQLLTAEHPSLADVGLSALTVAVEVPRAGAAGVVLATPSRGAVWGRACGGEAQPVGGVLFGDVRDAETGARLVGALAEVVWTVGGGVGGAADMPRRRAVTTDSVGAYRVCGVPTDLPLTVRARAGTDVGASVSVLLDGRALGRANLVLGRAGAGVAAR